jgi:hypothetical protein
MKDEEPETEEREVATNGDDRKGSSTNFFASQTMKLELN